MTDKKVFSPIKEIIKDARRGKMFILVDNKDRENEGDLVIQTKERRLKKYYPI